MSYAVSEKEFRARIAAFNRENTRAPEDRSKANGAKIVSAQPQKPRFQGALETARQRRQRNPRNSTSRLQYVLEALKAHSAPLIDSK
jgi:hypothetical protein